MFKYFPQITISPNITSKRAKSDTIGARPSAASAKFCKIKLISLRLFRHYVLKVHQVTLRPALSKPMLGASGTLIEGGLRIRTKGRIERFAALHNTYCYLYSILHQTLPRAIIGPITVGYSSFTAHAKVFTLRR